MIDCKSPHQPKVDLGKSLATSRDSVHPRIVTARDSGKLQFGFLHFCYTSMSGFLGPDDVALLVLKGERESGSLL